MTTPTELRIDARWTAQRLTAVSVLNSRPRIAPALQGTTPAEACARIPALFAICRVAQGAAATLACTMADDAADSRSAASGVTRALCAEMAQEHLWRLMLDWPAACGQAPRRADFAQLYRRLAGPRDAPSDAALGEQLQAFVAAEWPDSLTQAIADRRVHEALSPRTRDGGSFAGLFAALLDDVAAPASHEPVSLLPQWTATDWATALRAVPTPGFCGQPTLDGQPRETGVLSRQGRAPAVVALLERGQRVAARYCARILDLQQCASGLGDPTARDAPRLFDGACLGAGTGLARVETARGTLLHAVRVDRGRIADYAIVAPTEWNFHPRGPLVREAVGLEAADPDAARRRLERLVLALDPCVACEVSLSGPDATY